MMAHLPTATNAVRDRWPPTVNRIAAATSMTSLRASVSADMAADDNYLGWTVSRGSVGDVDSRRETRTPFGLPGRVVAVLRQMSPHADRLTWTVAEGADAVSVALAWDFTGGGGGAVCEGGERPRGRRSASCGNATRRGRGRTGEDGNIKGDEHDHNADCVISDDERRRRRQATTSGSGSVPDGNDRPLHNGRTSRSLRLWRPVRGLAVLRRLIAADRSHQPSTSGNDPCQATTDRSSKNQNSVSVRTELASSSHQLHHHRILTSGNGGGVVGTYDDGNCIGRMTNATSHLTETNADRKSAAKLATSVERGGGRHPGIMTRCASRLLNLPVLRRLRINRRIAAQPTSGRSDDDDDDNEADASDNVGRHRGRKLFTSTSLPERINRQSSVSAIVANRKPIDRDSSDSDMYSHQLSHDVQQRLQLDVSPRTCFNESPSSGLRVGTTGGQQVDNGEIEQQLPREPCMLEFQPRKSLVAFG
jgi:hypothetical protein